MKKMLLYKYRGIFFDRRITVINLNDTYFVNANFAKPYSHNLAIWFFIINV